MPTEQTAAAMRQELSALSGYGATLAELFDYLGEQNRRLGRNGLSDDQEEELQLYCWALHKSQSSGALWGRATVGGGTVGGGTVGGGLEDDIGA
jgi:hypothetical protein